MPDHRVKSQSPMRTLRRSVPTRRSYLKKGPTNEQQQRRSFLKETLRLVDDPLKEEDIIPSPTPSKHLLRRSLLAGRSKNRKKPVRRTSFGSTGGQKLRRNSSSNSLPEYSSNVSFGSIGGIEQIEDDDTKTPDGIMGKAVRRVLERQGRRTITRAKTDGTDLLAMQRSLQARMEDNDDDSSTESEHSGSGFLRRSLVTLEKLYETCQ